ncbi:hypothetical protein [Sinisalibacter lacisalsi]|nr:hypothetical protein [Sinisalibacter lacisalsi]
MSPTTATVSTKTITTCPGRTRSALGASVFSFETINSATSR